MLNYLKMTFLLKDIKLISRVLFEQNFEKNMNSLLVQSRVRQMNLYEQHGNTSTLLHCIAVAYFSCLLAYKFSLCCSEQELLRGALLHDYFLYDWHENNATHSWHGFTHPKKALKNAELDFRLTEKEKDIISKHMFPLTLALPQYRESILVCLVDKICSLYEVFKRDPYKNLSRKYTACQ